MGGLRFAAKQLVRNAGFSALAVLTLALGIGASALIFSVIDGVLLEPLPYPAPDRIVELREINERGGRPRLSDPNYFDIEGATGSFSALAQYAVWSESVAGGSEPVRTWVAAISREFFAALGVHPMLGREFAADELHEGAAPAALVSYGYWQRYLGGATDFESRSVKIGDRLHSIVGVMPAGFDYPADTAVWTPRELWPVTPRRAHNWYAIGRLAEGVTLGQARIDLGAIAQRLKAVHGDDTDMVDASVVPLHEELVGNVRPALVVLAAAAALLFFVACANVVSMLLARTVAREHEIAVRAALGAGRWRLAREFFAEALLLCSAGALCGVVLGSWGLDLVLALGGGVLPRSEAIGIDWGTLGVAAGLALGAAAALSIAAAWRAPGHASLQASRRTIASGSRTTLREALVAAQVALALVLVLGGTLLGRSFLRVADVDPGFETDGIVFMTLTLPAPRDEADRPRLARSYERIIAELRELPGIEAVGGLSSLPLAGGGTNGTFLKQSRIDEVPDLETWGVIAKDAGRTGVAEWRIASEGFFAAVGIPLLRGRTFEDRDRPGAVHAALISRSLGEREWPGEDPIGRLVNFAGMDGDVTPLEIVGIVGDVRDRVDAPPRDTIYAYYRQRPGGHLAEFSLALRAPDPTALVPAAREIVRSLEPDVPPEFVAAEEVFSRTLAQRRFNLVMLGAFGGAALVLALAGLYGAIAFSVAQRVHEIGVRIALGAQSQRVVTMVMKKTLAIAVTGIAGGLVVAFGGVRLVASLLYEVSPYDPTAYAVSVFTLLLVAVVASWLPALRAARVDPVTALRQD